MPKTPHTVHPSGYGRQNSRLHAAGPGLHCWVLLFGGLARSSRVDCAVSGARRGGKSEGKSGWGGWRVEWGCSEAAARFCVGMSVVSVQGYGPPGLPEREYKDVYGPYGPNVDPPPPRAFLRRRSEGFATGHRGHGTVSSLAAAGRIATPPHDMTAAQPHPSGHNLSFTGTWRASGKELQTSGMHSARENVHRLLTGTMPEAAARPAVRIHTIALPTATSVVSDAFAFALA